MTEFFSVSSKKHMKWNCFEYLELGMMTYHDSVLQNNEKNFQICDVDLDLESPKYEMWN